MRKLYLPLLFSNETHTYNPERGATIFGNDDGFKAFHTENEAKEFAKTLAARNPGAKIVIFEATGILEARKIEFTEKKFNNNGELLV